MRMFRSLAAAVAVASVMTLSGCASVPMAAADKDASAKQFTVAPGKANVYVYRNETFGAALKMPVTINGTDVGSTASKTYIYRQVNPGNQVIVSQGEASKALTVDAKAGNNYFVWQEVKMGLVSGGSQLQLVDGAKGKAGVAECSLVQ